MRFRKMIFNGVLLGFFPLLASAGTNEWSSGFGQGTTVYSIDDGNGNSLEISCPEGQARAASADMTTHGFSYSSPKDTAKQGMVAMSFVIDGVEFEDPFNTACTACESNFVHEIWPALLKANNLIVHADGYEVRFTTKGLRDQLLSLDDPANPCLTEFQALALKSETYSPAQKNIHALPAGFTQRAVIDDPDGYTNMRTRKSSKSQIVTRVVQGEEFFTYKQNDSWWQVRTAQGQVGYIHVSRIRLLK